MAVHFAAPSSDSRIACTRSRAWPRALRFAAGIAVAVAVSGCAATFDNRALGVGDLTFACGRIEGCPPQAAPGPADRQVQPFARSLGRPCGYRWRPTPSGTRKVRVCF